MLFLLYFVCLLQKYSQLVVGRMTGFTIFMLHTEIYSSSAHDC